jgi:uncharacterized protein
MAIDAEALLAEAAGAGTPAFRLLWAHGRAVADKALELARRLGPAGLDLELLEQAALLHDVGAAFTAVPELGLAGDQPYIRHGVLGRAFCEARGLVRHGLVCERHLGAGIGRDEIRTRRLPLPARDMRPLSDEEILIAYADKFFTKTAAALDAELSVAAVERGLARHGRDKVARFRDWHRRFSAASPGSDGR